MFDLVLKGGRIVSEQLDCIGDVGIQDGRIAVIHEGTSDIAGKEVVDCHGKYIFPGFLDLHVHFNDPGVTYREDFYTGSSAAAAGGVTLVADMPLANAPVTVSREAYNQKVVAARKNSVIDYTLWAGLVDNNCDEIEGLHDSGTYGFKAFTCYAGPDFAMATDEVVRCGLEKTAETGSFVGVHCEHNALIEKIKAECTEAGKSEFDIFVESHQPDTETVSVAAMIKLAEETGGHLHVCHASLPESIELVSRAKERGVKVTVETCTQYLLFTVDDLKRIGGPLKCTPPVRTEVAVEALWNCLQEGEIDFLVSDHSPATKEEKDNQKSFSQIWGGINGVQFLFPLLYTEGVKKRNFPLQKLVELYSAAPAKFMGIYPGRGVLREGAEATFVLFDPNEKLVLEEKHLLTKNRQSPYLGMKLEGVVESTWVQGKKVCQYENGEYAILAKAGDGRHLLRQLGVKGK